MEESADFRSLFVARHGLALENGMWYIEKENSHKAPVFRDVFLKRNDEIGVLFRFNRLCQAKVTYFRNNIRKYQPLKYDYRRGFVETELWDSDFLRHNASGHILDYRYLQTITVHADFVRLCGELERFETADEPDGPAGGHARNHEEGHHCEEDGLS